MSWKTTWTCLDLHFKMAQAFTATIPYKGTLVVMKDDYTKFFAKEAKKRKTKLIVVDKDEVQNHI